MCTVWGDRKDFRFGSYNEKICSETFAFSLDFEVSAYVVLFLRCLFGCAETIATNMVLKWGV